MEEISRDGLNWYGYCGNNPMGSQDPTGLVAVPDGDNFVDQATGLPCDAAGNPLSIADTATVINPDHPDQAFLYALRLQEQAAQVLKQSQERYSLTNIDHTNIQKYIPEGYDAIWVLVQAITFGGSAMINDNGFAGYAGSMSVTFLNCRTKEAFGANYLTTLRNNQMKGSSIGIEINIVQSGGYGIVPSNMSITEIATFFANYQPETENSSFSLLGTAKSENASWSIKGISANIGFDIPIKVGNAAISLLASQTSTNSTTTLIEKSVKSLGYNTWLSK